MEIKYKYKSQEIPLRLKNNSDYTNNQIIGFLKISLKRKFGLTLQEYLVYNGFNIEKCRLCNEGYPPINLKINTDSGSIDIIDFNYAKKIYCYGSNKECPGIKMNSNSFEFISKVNLISIDDAKKLLKENNKSPFYKESWNSEEDYKKSQSRNLDYYINKYGKLQGELKYKEHINKISISNSLESYINKYGTIDGGKKFNDISKSKDSMSLKYFLVKNRYDYGKALFEYEERKKSVDISLNNLIKKFGEEDGYRKHEDIIKKSKNTLLNNPNYKSICKSRGVTLLKMIEKHGVLEGSKKYYDWKISCRVPIGKASKESMVVFKDLIEYLIDNNFEYDDIYIGMDNKNEFFLRENNDLFFYDFTILSKKIIIEYNGILFHPKNENSNWINPFNKEDSKKAFDRQKKKIELAKKNNFKVLEIWSDEDYNLEKCLNFIKNNI